MVEDFVGNVVADKRINAFFAHAGDDGGAARPESSVEMYLALKKAGFAGSILGVSSDKAIADALRRGAIDRGLPLAEAEPEGQDPLRRVVAKVEQDKEQLVPPGP